MTVATIVQAINMALRQEMKRDQKVMILGEDVGLDGGVFRATDGLIREFGAERVCDTPLAELGIVGTSIGLAINGMRPVAEIEFSGFMYATFDQILSHAVRIRTRSRGSYSCPMVIRTPYGGGIRALELHCESGESIFAHVPGLKMVIPSNPYDAKGLLASAIRDPDPVIFYEPMRIYRAIKQDIPEEDYTVPLGKAQVVQEGSDITLISWGSMFKQSMDAVAKMNSKYSVELIDLRTISPLDEGTIIASVKKTGRCVVVHEAPKTCGFAAEIIAQINEKALLSLQAPVERVTSPDVPFPMSKLENYYFPSQERIVKGIEKVMSF
ncbi:TPA: alpha-ketoacid dehydrogenase subunit beta [Candidatus Woesearchaeota archaeon]|nr:alpha-ketoacid dehydrogenase subunit beta [Candidatus Woesearchaeota archaeon]HIH91348.1 alpha-ketoacid dehydrogenase subunit beta [Candidatus Woesearchaeota archaeon]HII65979.1 alpha-ketoacid dehydrogenase subunit beta [Candidatus Woesearchaeota archaeon]HIJ19116.1 alpha-ketoacid dehydrogenase subunit beta [Candidatus Woesearchaeota archaeon]